MPSVSPSAENARLDLAYTKLSRRAFAQILFCLTLGRSTYAAPASLDDPALQGLDQTDAMVPARFRDVGDGLLVQEITSGRPDAAPVEPNSRVSVKYVMRRSNGYYIDASYGFDRFENYTCQLGSRAVIPGFERAIIGMRPGARRRFVVPPSLGYSQSGTNKGSPGPIPPDWGARRSLASHANEPIIFEVQLVKIVANI